MDEEEAERRARQEREDRDEGIVKDPDRYTHRRGRLYSRSEIQTIYSVLQPRKDDIAVDLGCGVGRITLDLAGRVRSVSALDFSRQSVAILKRRIAEGGVHNVETAVADLRHLPLPSSTYTKAVCCQVIQHIPTDTWRLEALREVRRILKPGGRFACTVYQWGTMIRDRQEGDFSGRGYRKAFTEEELRDLFVRAGYTNVMITGLIHLPHRTIVHLPEFLWPVETTISRLDLLRRRATYLLGSGIRPPSRSSVGAGRHRREASPPA